jgi:hypothetical protein
MRKLFTLFASIVFFIACSDDTPNTKPYATVDANSRLEAHEFVRRYFLGDIREIHSNIRRKT